MSSNPGLDDDDDILLIPAEVATDKDLPPPVSSSSSSSISVVYPRWSENPNRLPIVVTPRPIVTQPIRTAWTLQGIELQGAASPARRTVIQMPGASDPPVSFTWAYVASCVVYWCFCLVLGSIAYGIAAMGENLGYDGEIAKAQFWRNVSYATSGAGVVLGIILMVVIFTVILPTYGQKTKY